MPVPAYALSTKKMGSGLGAVLLLLTVLLAGGMVLIVGASVREAKLQPGAQPEQANVRRSYNAMINALSTGAPDDFEAIPLGGTFKLANPQAAYCFAMEGADSAAITCAPAPAWPLLPCNPRHRSRGRATMQPFAANMCAHAEASWLPPSNTDSLDRCQTDFYSNHSRLKRERVMHSRFVGGRRIATTVPTTVPDGANCEIESASESF